MSANFVRKLSALGPGSDDGAPRSGPDKGWFNGVSGIGVNWLALIFMIISVAASLILHHLLGQTPLAVTIGDDGGLRLHLTLPKANAAGGASPESA